MSSHPEPPHLRALLQKSIDKQLKVVSCKATALLPKEGHFDGSLLKLVVTVKKSQDSPEEKIHLAAKTTLQSSENQEADPNIATSSFAKEMFVYEKLIVYYRKIEEEAGIDPEDLIDLLPKYYGGRLLVDKETGKAKKGTLMLMENLEERGYHASDDKNALDLECAKSATKALARFHALGVALKLKKPVFFEQARQALDKEEPFGSYSDDKTHEEMITWILKYPRLAEYEDRLRSCLSNKHFNAIDNVEGKEPWLTLIHNDFRIGNIMFHEKNEQIDDVKLIDFRTTKIGSPMRDLAYLLCSWTDTDVLENYFDGLIDVYYVNFVEQLGKMHCNVAAFTRESFDEQLKVDARNEFFRCLKSLERFRVDLSDDKEDSSDSAGSVFEARVWRIVSKYVEKEWM